MTTRTNQERAAQSIRGYVLNEQTTIRIARKTIDTAELLGIIHTRHRRKGIAGMGLSSWIDLKLNEEIEKVLQKLHNRIDQKK